MDAFLKESKRKLSSLTDESKVHVVLGNESCDLDSAVSAIVYAYFLHSLSKEQTADDSEAARADNDLNNKQTADDDSANVLYIPVLNIPREDYAIRTEVTHCLQANSIADDSLVFHDEVDLRTLQEKKQLLLTLVDHNVLAKSDSYLDDDVVEIIDHHKNARHDGDDRKLDVTLETVGSCATLVTERILGSDKEFLDETTVTLLLSTILVDTFNLSESAKKTTPKDESMVAELQQLCSHIDRHELFEGIEKVKFDVSGLSTTDLLRKDYKSLQGNHINIGLSSITLHLKDILQRPSLESDLQSYCSDKDLHLLLLINLALVDKDSPPQRQLGIYTPGHPALKDSLVKAFHETDIAQLELSELEGAPSSVAAFNQGNVAASRKKLMPIAQQFLEEVEKDQQRVKELLEPVTMDASGVDLLSGLDLLETSQVNPSTNQNNANDDDPFGLGSLSSPGPVDLSTTEQTAAVGDPFDLFGTVESTNTKPDQQMPSSSLLDLDPFGGNVQGGASILDGAGPGLLDFDPFGGVKTDVTSSEASLLPDLADLSDVNTTPQPPSLLDLDSFASMGDSPSPSSSSNVPTSDLLEPMATSPSSPSSLPMGEDLLGLDPFASSESAPASNPEPENLLDSSNANELQNAQNGNQNDNDLFGLDNLNNPSSVAISTENKPKNDKPSHEDGVNQNDIFNLDISNDVNNDSVNDKTSNDLLNMNGNEENGHSAPVDLLGLDLSTKTDEESTDHQDMSPIDQQIASPDDIKEEESEEDDDDGDSGVTIPKSTKNMPRTPSNSVSDFGDYLSKFQEKGLDREALSERVEELHRTKSITDADEEAEVVALNGDSHSIPREDSFSPSVGLTSSETFSDDPSDSSSGESYTVNEENRGLDQFPITEIAEDEEDRDQEDEEQQIEEVPEEVAEEGEEYVKNVVQMSSFIYKQEVDASTESDKDDDLPTLQNGDHIDDVAMTTEDVDGEDVGEVETPAAVEEVTVGKNSTEEMDQEIPEEVSEYVDTVVQAASFAYKEEAVETEVVKSEHEQTEVVQSEHEQTESSINELLSDEQTTQEGVVDSVETIDSNNTNDLLDAEQQVSDDVDHLKTTDISQSENVEAENMQKSEIIEAENMQQAAGAEFKDGGVTMETVLTKEEPNVCESDYNGGVDVSVNVVEDRDDTAIDGAQADDIANQQSDDEGVKVGGDDSVLVENQSNLECQMQETKVHSADVYVDTEEVKNFVENIIQMACYTHQEQVQGHLETSQESDSEEKLESSVEPNSDRDDDNAVSEPVISPMESAIRESGMSTLGDSSVPEVRVTEPDVSPSETTVTESGVVPTDGDITESAIPASEEIISPTEGSTTETAPPNAADDENATDDTTNAAETLSDAEKEDSIQDMDTSFDDDTQPSSIESTPSRPGTLALDSRGGKTKIKPVYAKPKNQAGTPASLLSEDGSIHSVTTLDAVNMFPITPSPGSGSDDDDLMGDRNRNNEEDDFQPPSPPKRLVSVDSVMAADISGDWSGEAEILQRAAARHKENSGKRYIPKLGEQGPQLSVASAEAKQRMEGIQIPEEWQDDEFHQHQLSSPDDADEDFYKRSVPKMDSIMEDGRKVVTTGTSTTTETDSDLDKQKVRVDSDLKRFRGDSDMSTEQLGENQRGVGDGEEKFGSRKRHMSEDSLEDDIAYLEEVGELDVSDGDDEDDAGEGARPKKKIPAELDLDQIDGPEVSVSSNGAAVLSPATTEEMSWDDAGGTGRKPEKIPEYSAREEMEDKKNWRRVMIGGKEHAVDMRAINPYKKVLSHGGYYGDGLNAIIVFASCYMPDKSRNDYSYVMHNLFLYVVSTLELLVAQDYMIIYFHGAAPKSKIPSLGWMRKCYKMIDRKLRKNLKGLYLVHPTTWLKTVVRLTRPFVSSKFSSKLKFIYTLEELEKLLPMDFVYVPEEVRRHDERIKRKENGRHWWGWLGYTNTLSNDDDEFDETCDGSELSSIDDLDDLLFPQLPPERNKNHQNDFDFPSSPQSTTSDERILEAEMESSDSGCSDHEDLHQDSVEGGGFMEDDIFAYSSGNNTVTRTPRPLFISARRRQSQDGDRTPTNEVK